MDFRHRVVIASSLEDISKLVEKEIKDFSQTIDDDDLIFNFRLILNELLINAGKHGNKWNQDKMISYTAESSGGCLRITVEDEGEGMSSIPTYDPKSIESSGRGLKIVKELCDNLIVSANKVTIEIYPYDKN